MWWIQPKPGSKRSWRQRERLQARLQGRGNPTLRELWPLLVACALAAAAAVLLLRAAAAAGGPAGLTVAALLYLTLLVRLVLWRGAVVRRRRGRFTAAEAQRLSERQVPAVALALLTRDGWDVHSRPWQGAPRIVGRHRRTGRLVDVTFRRAEDAPDTATSAPGPGPLRAAGAAPLAYDGVIRLLVTLGKFSRSEVLWAAKRQVGLYLVDGAMLERWAAGTPLAALLGLDLGTPPRRSAG